ncbi:hypothetical protein CC78DRAFT_616681 [Lojkania enalia]|uniref:Uncharacterized protein n=1 Tax=Lojkania enalia TaxID=147567 RepID=A0A9P4K830_9PLEO|nr:hypothetical protein CC78DRAFT_616681 [Didymosphaeria enalia]
MSSLFSIFALLTMVLQLAVAIENDCSMSDSTRCDCIFNDGPDGTLRGTDCRVCRVGKEMNLYCVLWGSYGQMYGPLCEDNKCVDGKGTPEGCFCDWQPKEHERVPCPTPAGDCKCEYVLRSPSVTVTSVLPGETCMICPVDMNGSISYQCTEIGNKKNGYGPLCTGPEFGPQCRGNGCFCNWAMTTLGGGWKNEGT